MGRCNRSISKFPADREVVKSRTFSAKETAFSHEDVDYEDEYKGLDDMAVEDRVIPLLIAMENEEIPVLMGLFMGSWVDEIAVTAGIAGRILALGVVLGEWSQMCQPCNIRDQDD